MHLPTRSSLGRTGTAALAAVMLAGVLGAQASQAAPSRDLDQVAAQVRDLEMQAGAAHERAEQARDRLAGIQEKLGTITNRLERERREMRVMQSTIEDIARATYAGGGVDPTLQVLLAEDPAEFLAQAAVMDQLQQVQVDQLRRRADDAPAAGPDRGRDLRQRGAGAAGPQRDGQRRGRGQRPAGGGRGRPRRPPGGGAAAAAPSSSGSVVSSSSTTHARPRRSRGSRPRRPPQRATTPRQDDSPTAVSRAVAAPAGTAAAPSTAARPRPAAATPVARGRAAVQYALSQVGDPYSYSANPPSSWDCSKLTAAAWGAGRRRTDRAELHPVGPDATRARVGDPARRPRLLLRQWCPSRGHLRRQRQDGQRLEPQGRRRDHRLPRPLVRRALLGRRPRRRLIVGVAPLAARAGTRSPDASGRAGRRDGSQRA